MFSPHPPVVGGLFSTAIYRGVYPPLRVAGLHAAGGFLSQTVNVRDSLSRLNTYPIAIHKSGRHAKAWTKNPAGIDCIWVQLTHISRNQRAIRFTNLPAHIDKCMFK